MRFCQATVLITGGNSGIGRALAEALASVGARIIITGRNPASLQKTLEANPGIAGYRLDVSQAAEVARFAAAVVQDHPALNVVVNNAGIMLLEDMLADAPGWDDFEKTIATNLLAPMRLTTALLPHLRSRTEAAIVNVSSGLAFVPRAATPTYGATKAALHSWTQALRHQLRDTAVLVVELIPPLVATNFAPGQDDNANALPLPLFIAEVVELLCAEVTPTEVVVKRARPQRMAERTGDFDAIFRAINSR